MANGKECVHPICCLADLVVLIASRMVLSHSHDKVENCDERPNRIGIASKHQIAETDIIVSRDMTSCDPCERGLISNKYRKDNGFVGNIVPFG